MSVKIAHAVGDENGKARGGKSGDQTGKEVTLSCDIPRSAILVDS